MSKAEELAERAQMFEKSAEMAMERSSRQHYREMAAHYRALSIEHREIADLQKPLQAEFRFGASHLRHRSAMPTDQPTGA